MIIYWTFVYDICTGLADVLPFNKQYGIGDYFTEKGITYQVTDVAIEIIEEYDYNEEMWLV